MMSPDASFTFGISQDPQLEGKIRVTIILTGLDWEPIFSDLVFPVPNKKGKQKDKDPQKTVKVEVIKFSFVK